MTPKETHEVIRAYIWQKDLEQKSRVWLSWHIAALVRAKRFPKYSEMIPKKTVLLTKEEKERKRAEFEELVRKIENGRTSGVR